MKILKLISKFLYRTSAIYAVISFGMTVIGHSFKTDAGYGPTLSFALCDLLFSVVCAAAITFTEPARINGLIKGAIKFLVCFAAFIVSFFAIPKNMGQISALAIFSTLFIIVYAAAAYIGSLFRKAENEKKSSDEYEEIYKDKN